MKGPGEHPLLCVPAYDPRCLQCRERSARGERTRKALAPHLGVAGPDFDCPVAEWRDPPAEPPPPESPKPKHSIHERDGRLVCLRCERAGTDYTITSRPCTTCSKKPATLHRCSGCRTERKVPVGSKAD